MKDVAGRSEHRRNHRLGPFVVSADESHRLRSRGIPPLQGAGDAALAQLDDASCVPGPNGGNSAAVLVWHIGGNLASRFTDFLDERRRETLAQRDEEFVQRTVTRPSVLEKWNTGWNALFNALDGLTDDHLRNTVTIRGQSFEVHDALHRALATFRITSASSCTSPSRSEANRGTA
jgi:hypothetical protein